MEAEYGRPRLGNPRRPIDDLFFVMVSNRTAPATAAPTFRSLKKQYPRWEALAHARLRQIERVLRPAGLSAKKAEQMRGIARQLLADFGRCTLAPLSRMSDDAVRGYLTSLPGVSDKVALCVMMYTMDRDVLPVDVHVHRIARRLGWVNKKRADQCHDLLAALVPPQRRYAFHVDCIQHGRRMCAPRRPRCAECRIAQHCTCEGGL
jgi:endonuclease-3